MGLLITRHLKKKEKIEFTKKQQYTFIQLLADLLKNGFTLQESLLFMEKSHAISKPIIHFLVHLLEQGELLNRGLAFLGVSTEIVTQIEFAQKHGKLQQTLEKINQHMYLVHRQRQNFLKVISYPILLVLFLIIVIVSLRQFLLPQLISNGGIEKNNLGILFIQQSPYYLLGVIFVIGATYLIIKKMLKKKTALKRVSYLAALPIVGHFYRMYYSAFFALEWGKLFFQGLEIKAVVELMYSSSQLTLMKEIAHLIKESSEAGETFSEQLIQFHFFAPELATIIQQGEVKGNLGKELILYSDICWQRFFSNVEKAIQWIQPIIFLLVGILVVSVYLAMLLPMYGGMDNFL